MPHNAITSILLLVILSSYTLTCNVLALNSNLNEINQNLRPLPNQLSPSSYTSSALYRVRGGLLEKKGKFPFGVSAVTSSNASRTDNEEEVIDASHKKTTLHTQSSVIQGSNDADSQYRSALIKTAFTVLAAVVFGVTLMSIKGVTAGYEFFAGYLIEQSLSIDNLFVFIMLFEYFKVPKELQNRVLSWGITGAIILRGLMIGVGVAALQKFKSVVLVFAFILLASSAKLLLEKETTDSEEHEENLVMKLTKTLFPNTSSELHGEKFFVEENGKRIATPLFLCLIAVELSDFVFAVDSIPAVLGVSKDPLIVYASNIFAIVALRSLYTVVVKAVSSFQYLKPAVALVLGFVGSKMIAEYFHVEIGTGVSLAVICSLLGSGVIASITENERKKNYLTIESSTLTNSTMTIP